MNYLEICGILLHVSIGLCILVVIFALPNAMKDENDAIYQEAEKERENAPDEIKVMAIDSDVGLVDLSDEANHIWKDSEIDTDYLNYLDNLDLESMKYKKKKS